MLTVVARSFGDNEQCDTRPVFWITSCLP